MVQKYIENASIDHQEKLVTWKSMTSNPFGGVNPKANAGFALEHGCLRAFKPYSAFENERSSDSGHDDGILVKKVAGSERLNTAKIKEGLRSFVTAVATDERKFYAM